MKKWILILSVVLSATAVSFSADFSLRQDGNERTLRLDYIFAGDNRHTEISLDEMSCFDGWAGRHVNLGSVQLKGNGQLLMRAVSDGRILYRNSFSTLFQEWKATEEAVSVRRSFENVFLAPMPAEKALVRIELYGYRGEINASFEHIVDPEDILIRRLPKTDAPYRMLLQSGAPEDCIDIAIVAEGYTASEAGLFYADAKTAMDEILSYEPFTSCRERFNFIAVALPSAESGVSVPHQGLWKNTALGSHFSTFYSERYLTTLRLRHLHDQLAGLPYEHIVILANTDTYGGGGIYNSYTLTTAHHLLFRPVVVHEFGHSFAGLADEYYYDDQYEELYYPDAEPWEQNISTLKDFGSKWKDMLPEDMLPKDMLPGDMLPKDMLPGGCCAISRPVNPKRMWRKIAAGAAPEKYIGIYEGAGYQSKGVYRGYPDCRMHTNEAPVFCPVCQAAIKALIDFNTKELCK